MNAPSGALSLITTVSVPAAVTEVTGQVGLQVHADFRSRSMFHTTAAALNGVPSVNVTPGRTFSVHCLGVSGDRIAGGQARE